MNGEYFVIILIGYVLYPLILKDLYYILRNRLSKEGIISLLETIIIPIDIFIGSFFSNNNTMFDGLFVGIIEYVTPYMLIAYLITYTVVLIRFIINKIKNL